MPEDRPPTREQLLGARARILAQLDEIDFRTRASCARGGPPDYSAVVSQLQEEVRQIDALLSIDESPAPDIPWG